ncbi:hypothetical protein [Nocardioides convexus]|uniref:hypothetical protein n=1 Tax=Nocardioides convexus TaxID=2712224 RepID=UPI002418B838|nr:hypothetical protein [Nocardioides convexus]
MSAETLRGVTAALREATEEPVRQRGRGRGRRVPGDGTALPRAPGRPGAGRPRGALRHRRRPARGRATRGGGEPASGRHRQERSRPG